MPHILDVQVRCEVDEMRAEMREVRGRPPSHSSTVMPRVTASWPLSHTLHYPRLLGLLVCCLWQLRRDVRRVLQAVTSASSQPPEPFFDQWL